MNSLSGPFAVFIVFAPSDYTSDRKVFATKFQTPSQAVTVGLVMLGASKAYSGVLDRSQSHIIVRSHYTG